MRNIPLSAGQPGPGLTGNWLLPGALVMLLLASAPALSQSRLTVDHLDQHVYVSDPQISPDGEWVAYVTGKADLEEDEEVSTLWMINWEGDEQLQLTRGPKSASNPRWSPDGKKLAFITSGPDDEDEDQVWVFDLRGGEPAQLTDLPGSVSDFSWSPDGTRMALVAELKDEEGKKDEDEDEKPEPIVITDYHFKADYEGYLTGPETERIYLFDIASKSVDALTADAGFDESNPTWSPDGTRIAFISNRDEDPGRTENPDVFVAEAKPAAPLVQLTDFKGFDLGPLAWSPDGERVAFVRGPEPRFWLYPFSQVAIVPADGGEVTFPTAALDRDTVQPRFSQNGRSIDFIVEDDRSRYLARAPAMGGDIERITEPGQVISQLTGAGRRAAVLLSRPGEPHEIYALEGRQLRQLTRHNDAWLESLELGAVSGIEFDSRDGEVRVSAVLTTPPGYVAGQRYPTILWIHGGPYGQDQYSFDFERQLLAANGYVVVQVNYRGSSGRGVAFGHAIFADWGNKDKEDLLAAIDYLIEEGIADPERLGLGGWSFGGILTNYVIASDTRFKAAISGAGAANYMALYGHDEYVFNYDVEFGPPWENPELWIKVSYPFFEADRIRTPTFYLGGQEDWNVPILGSEQMYQALKTLGVPTQLVVYPEQHHSFSRHSFNKDVYERYLAWYEKYLHGKDDGSE